MKIPKMILFDFGETLITEVYTPIDGTRAVMELAAKNPKNVTCEEIQSFADELNADAMSCGGCEGKNMLETHLHSFFRYMFEYFGIELGMTYEEAEKVYFNASIVSRPVPHIRELLDYLHGKGIRTAVISNMSYSGALLDYWLKRELPWNRFEFVIASSDYLFKKPSPRIFNLALKKAGLNADDVCYCGNSLFNDINGAHSSNIWPVWYKGARWSIDGGTSDVPHSTVSDWRELIDMIDKGGLLEN